MVYAMAAPTHLYIKVLNAYLTILCYFAVLCLGQSPLRNSLFSQKQKTTTTVFKFSKQCHKSSDLTEYIYQ